MRPGSATRAALAEWGISADTLDNLCASGAAIQS
jgi:hypothetical protein